MPWEAGETRNEKQTWHAAAVTKLARPFFSRHSFKAEVFLFYSRHGFDIFLIKLNSTVMQKLPFDIPDSLGSYLAQFESNPDKGIANLEAYLRKRGMDAVGFFLLSWMYLKSNRQDEALNYALKAKCYAPGSPFFEHLHFFLAHPDQFQAPKPTGTDIIQVESPTGYQTAESLNLDQLIEKLNEAGDKKITIAAGTSDDRNLSEKSGMTDDIASETLARIYEKQEKYDHALRTLDKLIQIRPHKADHFNNEKMRIRERMEQASE